MGGTVYEASELLKNHRCKDPICDTNLWKVQHELDMAKLKMRNLEAELLSKGIIPEDHNGTINALETVSDDEEENDFTEEEEGQEEIRIQKSQVMLTDHHQSANLSKSHLTVDDFQVSSGGVKKLETKTSRPRIISNHYHHAYDFNSASDRDTSEVAEIETVL